MSKPLSTTMLHHLRRMARLEQVAAKAKTCPNAIFDGRKGSIPRGTGKALLRRGLVERVQWCRFGADWPELRLTEDGRAAAPEPDESDRAFLSWWG